MNVSEQLIREIVEQVLRETMGQQQPEFVKSVDKSGVMLVKTDTVRPKPFEHAENVYITDVSTLEESPRVGFGVMEMKEGANFAWTLRYDEVDILLEGTLEIEIDGRVVTGRKNDVIFIPKNSSIRFRTPDSCRFFYCVHPADWWKQ